MQDFIYDTDKELRIADGDFAVAESSIQHQELLLITNKGEWKENPTIAVGSVGFLKDDDEAGLLSEIKTELERDGMQIDNIDLTEEKIIINAHY
jgi:hypothetical protein